MARNLTPGQREAYARVKTSVVEVWALEFRHPTFPAPIRIVNYEVDLQLPIEVTAPIDGGEVVEFVAMGFKLKEPEINTQADTTFDVQVDGVSGGIQPYLAAANKTIYPVEATMRPYIYDIKTGVASGPNSSVSLQVRDIGITKTSVALSMGYTNSANRSFPAAIYTAQTNPGLAS